jgi:transposase
MGFSGLTEEKWQEINRLMNWTPSCLERGTKRSDFRQVWNSILYILTTGCRWKDLPQKPEFASRSSAHRWLKKWEEEGVLRRVLYGLIDKAAREGKVDWERLVVDGTFSLSTWRGPGSRLRLEGQRDHHSRIN